MTAERRNEPQGYVEVTGVRDVVIYDEHHDGRMFRNPQVFIAPLEHGRAQEVGVTVAPSRWQRLRLALRRVWR